MNTEFQKPWTISRETYGLQRTCGDGFTTTQETLTDHTSWPLDDIASEIAKGLPVSETGRCKLVKTIRWVRPWGSKQRVEYQTVVVAEYDVDELRQVQKM